MPADRQLPRLGGFVSRRSEDVTERVFVARGSGAFLAESLLSLIRSTALSRKHSCKGYAFDDDTTRTEDGRYRARAILVTVGNAVRGRNGSSTLKRSRKKTMRVSAPSPPHARGSMKKKTTGARPLFLVLSLSA